MKKLSQQYCGVIFALVLYLFSPVCYAVNFVGEPESEISQLFVEEPAYLYVRVKVQFTAPEDFTLRLTGAAVDGGQLIFVSSTVNDGFPIPVNPPFNTLWEELVTLKYLVTDCSRDRSYYVSLTDGATNITTTSQVFYADWIRFDWIYCYNYIDGDQFHYDISIMITVDPIYDIPTLLEHASDTHPLNASFASCEEQIDGTFSVGYVKCVTYPQQFDFLQYGVDLSPSTIDWLSGAVIDLSW